MTKNFNQRFASFQKVMRQTIKDIVLQMIPDIPQQQYQMQPPSFQDAFLSQQLLSVASFPSQNALQTQTQPHPTQFTNIYNSSLPPQLNIHQQSSTTNIPSSSYQSFIPSQSFTLNKSTPPHQTCSRSRWDTFGRFVTK